MKQVLLKPLVSDGLWPWYVRWTLARTPQQPDRLFRRSMYQRMMDQQSWIASFLQGAIEDRTVHGGPFAGLRYPTLQAVGSTLAPKLLGTYEAEIQDFFRDPARSDYRTVVDVGCAEGYYAVGTALLFPRSSVHAFDISADAQQLCRNLAEYNEVGDQVTVSGRCDPETLRSLAGQRSLVISDCEGGEMALLPQSLIAQLQQTDFVVEVHENLGADVQELRARFEPTHECRHIPSRSDLQRLTDYHPDLIKHLPDHQRIVLLSECRSPYNSWLIATARSG